MRNNDAKYMKDMVSLFDQVKTKTVNLDHIP